MGFRIRLLMMLVWLAMDSPAQAAVATARLPGWVCGQGEAPLFIDGFEAGDGIYREPSHGSGGAYPGVQQRSVMVSGQPRSYHLYVPAGYPFAAAVPLLLALHGSGGPGTAPAAAQALRDDWATQAQAGGFIVAAPVASGQQGGWVPGTDYPALQAIIADLSAHYDIDLSRIHGWGYSSGGHVMHDLALNQRNGVPDIRTFAAYGVSAGVLQGLACGASNCGTLLSQAARRIPVDLRVGVGDPLGSYVESDRDAFLHFGWSHGQTLRYSVFPDGHVVYPGHFADTWQFLCPFQRRLD